MVATFSYVALLFPASCKEASYYDAVQNVVIIASVLLLVTLASL